MTLSDRLLKQSKFQEVLTVLAYVLASSAVLPTIIYTVSIHGRSFGNDYAAYVPFLQRFVLNGFSISDLIASSGRSSHYVAFSHLFRVLAIETGTWNAQVEQIASIVLGLARLWFFAAISFIAVRSGLGRAICVCVSAAMIFAPAQIGIYIYGDTGLTMGPDLLGFTIGLWGVLRFPRTWRGVLTGCAGGALSAWSWGMGVTWITLAAALLVGRYDWRKLGAFFAAAVMVHLPLVYSYKALSADVSYDFFNWAVFIGGLGRPFVANVDDIGRNRIADVIACAGLVVLALQVVAGWRRRREEDVIRNLAPGCLFATFTLLSLYQIALVRTAVGPWYVAIAALFWIGLFINAVVLFERMRSTLSVRLAAGACTAVVSALYASANYSFASKTPFLQSRALSADSCMRAYKTAPTFCEMIVFIWPPTYEFASFGRFFDEAGLGASGRYETDTLQGDWVLNTVRLQQRPDRPQIQWDAPGTYSRGRPANWLTAQPLSLALPAGQSLTWEPIRPPVVVSEVLRSSVENHSSGPATLRVSVLHDGKAQVVRNVEMRVGERIELSEDLATTMAGGDKLLLAAESEDADGYLSLYYPRIDIDRVRPKTVRVTQKYRDIQGVPDNAEFSPHPEFSNTPNDAIFRAPEAAPVWDQMYNDLFKPVGGAPCIGDADAFKVSIAVPANISTRMIRLLVGARKYTGDYRQSEVQIPLLADGGMHTYTVPVRFYDLDARDRFESARIYSWSGVGTVEQQQTPVEIKELRLVAHPPVDGSACRP